MRTSFLLMRCTVLTVVKIESEMSTFSVIKPIIKYFYFEMTWKNTLLDSENLVMHIARLFWIFE